MRMDKDKLCIIFGAGDVFPPTAERRKNTFDKNTLVIAADGGYEKATRLGLEPDVAIGDFDSGECPRHTDAFVIKLNRDKDDTDMLAAVKVGLRRECKTFAIYGGVGGRLDHTAANFAVLKYLNGFDARGFLVDEHCIATVVTDGKFILPKNARGTVSVLAYGGDAEGVCIKGLKYELKDALLTPDFPIGVSNETLSETHGTKTPVPEISVKHGSLLIFFPRG